MRTLAILLFLLAPIAAVADPVSVCRANANPQKCAFEAAKAHPTKRSAFWRSAMARPLDERIESAPRELVELLALDNVANGFPSVPRASTLAPEFLSDVKRAFAELPEPVRRRLERSLAGIYFVDDIGSTGFSDEVVDDAGQPVEGFIVLDPTVLGNQSANAWATWKEASPFRSEPGWKLEAQIEGADRDDRVHAIQYILLHELGHVLSIGNRVHPRWTLPPHEAGLSWDYPFFALSWRIVGDRYVSLFDDEFARRGEVVFYFGPKLEGGDLRATYAMLEQTNFPTLYASTHPADDFAESFANYVHVVMMRRPFEIRLLQNGRVVKRYRPCWAEARCAAKRGFLERFLGP